MSTLSYADTPAGVQPTDAKTLDALTGGAFSAPTSGERAARIRQWLATEPAIEQMQAVHKELSHRDKGAAKPLKEKLDEFKRNKAQETVATEWADKAQTLLALSKLNLADALAWQRDAAKAGAPLSKEPLASLKLQLAERVKTIEDLQHRAQVQREAAVLIAQRIEVLSIKPWSEAQAALDGLRADVADWQAQADALSGDVDWSSVDAKFAPLLEASRGQLLAVWQAFGAALAVAVEAAADHAAPLPAVPVWADELRAARGLAQPEVARAKPPKIDPAERQALRDQATASVQAALRQVEQEVSAGHGKATPKAAAQLRQALKDGIRHIDSALEAAAHAALSAAGELEDWQRWRADQIRDDLVAKAEALVAKPLGGRKQQEALRHLREQWKTSDQGGIPNHALWKRFDDACNQAHLVVEAWLEKIKEQTEAVLAERRVLIDEVQAWAQAHADNTDWKHHVRALSGFVDKWRNAGHLGEKAFAEIQPVWKAAMDTADAPLMAARAASVLRRQALIAEAQALSAEATLRLDAVKPLQQRWQHEAQAVPLERKQEQKLWDAFRQPIDQAFQRKSAEREQAAAQLSAHDGLVLAAAQALKQATTGGDASQIHAAAQALEAILRGETPAQAAPQNPDKNQALAHENKAPDAIENIANEVAATDAAADAAADLATEPAADQSAEARADVDVSAEEPVSMPAAAEVAKPTAKPVVAVRGDDRPGMKKAEPVGRGKPGDRPGKPTDRRDARRDERGAPSANRSSNPKADAAHKPRPSELNPPRLGDAAFRAQREAFEAANLALKNLALQAHGAVLTHLLAAWEQRDPAQLPPAQDLGKRVSLAVRNQWLQALSTPAVPTKPAQAEALLRLEIAAELPTPAAHMHERRLLQLQLLTRRHAPAPLQTWAEDTATVLQGSFDAEQGRRLQQVLKVLFKS